MPIIFCSAKLSKLIGLKDRLPSLSIDNWNAHLFSLEGRKCIVFVHKETFYSFVVFDILKKQLTNLQQIFIDNFIAQLINDKILVPGTENFIKQHFQNFELSTTDGDKSTIGFINDCISRLTWEVNGQKPSITATKKYVANYYNDNPLISRKGVTPIALMEATLKSFFQL